MSRLDALARTERLLVALDFDGTLAPIVPLPEQARILPEAGRILSRFAVVPGTALAVITGRDVADVSARIPFGDRSWIAGSHGRKLVAPGEAGGRAPRDPRLDPFLHLEMPDGVRREEKETSVAFHWRGRDGGEPSAWTAEAGRLAREAGLEILPGRMVLEILAPGASKEDALAEIAREVGATGVFYAGDDTTDLAAISWAACRGVGILVRSPERPIAAPVGAMPVDGPDGLVEVLSRLLEARSSGA